MSEPAVPVRGLFEAHLTVGDLGRSVAFYRDVVGLPPALEVPERGAAFFWCGAPGKTMLGLWSKGSMPMALSLHVAFDVELEDVLASPGRLRALGVTPYSFFGQETEEPTRLFSGLMLAEDTNERFHFLGRHQRSNRLSTAFDGPTQRS